MLTATCPNDPNHDRFITTAHVMEEWRVTRHGDYIETVRGLETTHPPDAGNSWESAVCGAAATVRRG